MCLDMKINIHQKKKLNIVALYEISFEDEQLQECDNFFIFVDKMRTKKKQSKQMSGRTLSSFYCFNYNINNKEANLPVAFSLRSELYWKNKSIKDWWMSGTVSHRCSTDSHHFHSYKNIQWPLESCMKESVFLMYCHSFIQVFFITCLYI